MDFNREMVSVALSLLDRYLSKVAVAIREFRLVAICSFYISAKAMCKKFVPVVRLVFNTHFKFRYF